jgi:hypothetical protein
MDPHVLDEIGQQHQRMVLCTFNANGELSSGNTGCHFHRSHGMFLVYYPLGYYQVFLQLILVM